MTNLILLYQGWKCRFLVYFTKNMFLWRHSMTLQLFELLKSAECKSFLFWPDSIEPSLVPIRKWFQSYKRSYKRSQTVLLYGKTSIYGETTIYGETSCSLSDSPLYTLYRIDISYYLHPVSFLITSAQCFINILNKATIKKREIDKKSKQ